jgi:polyisoprenoid-binding protein YceI
MDRRDKRRLNRRATGVAMALAMICLAGCNSLASAVLAPKIDTAAATLAPGDFVLDTTHAALLFRINHLGFADYAGRFDRFEASLSGDAASPAEARVEAIIDMTSLNIANPDFASELTGPGWFDAAAHPEAIFRSRSIELTSDTAAVITGDLTLKGVTRPITLSARLNGSAYDPLRRADVIGFSATSEISRAAFGIDRFSGLLADSVRIEIEAEFIRQTPD